MPLTSSIQLTVNASLSGATALGATPKAVLPPYSKLVEMTTGFAAGQADRMFYAQRTIAPSNNDDLDLAGVLLDVFGQAITFARIKALFVSAIAVNTNNVVVGAAGANPWITFLNATGTLTLKPGDTVGAFSGIANAVGWPVTGGTGDILRVANSAAGTPVDYEIVIIGASA